MNDEKKLGQEPAFPVSDPNTALAMFNAGVDPTGISKRFYAACQIAPPIISSILSDKERAQNINDLAKKNGSSYDVLVIKMVYQLVDELLKQNNYE